MWKVSHTVDIMGWIFLSYAEMCDYLTFQYKF